MWRLTPQDNYEYEKLKRVLPFSLAIILASVSLPVTALADSAKVVTLGANLSDEQKASMYNTSVLPRSGRHDRSHEHRRKKIYGRDRNRIPDWYKNI